MLKLDKKFLEELEKSQVKKIKVFLYAAGCSGSKIDIIIDDFELTDDLLEIPHPNPLLDKERGMSEASGRGFKIYIPKTDKKHLENARITRTITADHTGKEKVRYILSSEQVQERCGCGSSFAFEKKAPKIDVEKLKMLRENFKNNS